ncbi:sigma-54 dependent transcriptional regulator [Akkermansiaceae bacterium]|nr:sigma-54 dependent transcriptional regulator [Akkermansiaceae bacterium]
MSQSHILLVDDDAGLAEAVQAVLESRGYQVTHHDDGEVALKAAEDGDFDLVLTDYRMPGMGGMQLLESLQESAPRLPVIMMTAFSTTDRAIEATKKGAFDYLIKPFEMPELLDLAEKAITSRKITAKPVAIGREDSGKDSVIGSSRAMQNVFKEIGKIADKPIAVLIKGETGSGKELIARAIFQHSDRSKAPFIAVNCAAIPDNLIESELFGHERGAFTGAITKRIGRFEQAHGGTLFLDEIGDLPWQTQVKLLRVLQEKVISRVGGKDEIPIDVPIDVRIVSATHRDLEQMITDESFRQDLFFRLNASVINLPPLRDRTDDIPALVNYFLAKYSREFQTETPSIHKDALACLSKQQWPGNVRQLENVVRRALIDARGFTITQRMVEDSMAVSPAALDDKGDQGSLATHVQNRLMAASKGDLPDGAFAALSADLEEELYRQAVALSHGNQSNIAKWLGVSRMTVRDKLDKYDLFPKRDR